MNILLRWLIAAIAVLAAAYVLPGVEVANFVSALIVALVLGIINVTIRPLLVILTLPVTIITFGLFLFVINALLILLVGAIVPGFVVAGFWWALFFSLIVSLVTSLLQGAVDRD